MPGNIFEDLETKLMRAKYGLMVGPTESTTYQCSLECKGTHYSETTGALKVPCTKCGKHWVIVNSQVTMALPLLEDVQDILTVAIKVLGVQGAKEVTIWTFDALPYPEDLENLQGQIDSHCPREGGDHIIQGIPFPQIAVSYQPD